MCSIAICSDDDQVSQLLRQTVETAGHSVCLAADSTELPAVLTRRDVDVLLVVPGHAGDRDGVSPGTRDLDSTRPVVVLGVAPGAPAAGGAPRFGAFDCAKWPGRSEELLDVIAGVARRAVRGGAQRGSAPIPCNGLAEHSTPAASTGEAGVRSCFQGRLDLALRSAGVGLWDWDPHDNSVSVSDEYSAQLGLEPAEATGGYEAWVARLHDADREAVTDALQRCISGETLAYKAEFRMRHKNGSWRWILANGEAIRDADGRVRRVLGCHIDITDRRQAEENRRAMDVQLRQTQKLEAIGILASGVAHEVNNPINGIMNYAQMLKDDPDDSAQTRRLADEIIRETGRVATIVRSLLAFARHDSHEKSDVSLRTVVSRTVSLLRAVLEQDGIDLREDIPADLPLVRCNVQEIQQVIMNLLTNARDALNAKYKRADSDKVIRIYAARIDGGNGPEVRLTVEDHGAGVPEEARAHIFDPFYTTKGRDVGSGLGLTIGYKIMKEHRGSLSVETELGEYTRFHATLPAVDIE